MADSNHRAPTSEPPRDEPHRIPPRPAKTPKPSPAGKVGASQGEPGRLEARPLEDALPTPLPNPPAAVDTELIRKLRKLVAAASVENLFPALVSSLRLLAEDLGMDYARLDLLPDESGRERTLLTNLEKDADAFPGVPFERLMALPQLAKFFRPGRERGIVLSIHSQPRRTGWERLLREFNLPLLTLHPVVSGGKLAGMLQCGAGSVREVSLALDGTLQVAAWTIASALERARAEQLLKAAQVRWESLVERSLQGLVVAQEWPPRIRYVNRALAEMMGYTFEEVCALGPEGVFQLIHPDDRDHFFSRYRERLAGDRSLGRLEFRAFTRSGEVRWLEAFASPVIYDGMPAVQAVFIDITERKTRENAQREAEARYRALVENAPLGIFVVNREHKPVYANARFGALFGLPPEAPLPEHLTALLSPEERQNFRARLSSLEIGHTISLPAVLARRADQTEFYAEFILTAIPCEGSPCIQGIVRDVTEAVQAQKERERQAVRSQQTAKVESLGHLAGGIAHDYNNLLVAIMGSADLMRLDAAPDSPMLEYLKLIRNSSERAAQITNQILLYTGKARTVRLPTDCSGMLRRLRPRIEREIAPSIQLQWDLAEMLPKVKMDAEQIEQAVLNLVTNAAEAIGTGEGTITIRTGLVTADRDFFENVYFHENPGEGEYVFLEVADSGCGMTEEVKARMFDPFFTTKLLGRGLGLAVVFGVVRSHQGAISVASRPGEGTSVKLFLPGERIKPASAADGQPLERRGTVLIISRDEALRRLFTRILQGAGLEVLPATDSADARRYARERAADIRAVLMDGFPVAERMELLAHLRRELPLAPVALNTDNLTPEDFTAFRLGGVGVFLPSPCPVRTLREQVLAIVLTNPQT